MNNNRNFVVNACSGLVCAVYLVIVQIGCTLIKSHRNSRFCRFQTISTYLERLASINVRRGSYGVQKDRTFSNMHSKHHTK